MYWPGWIHIDSPTSFLLQKYNWHPVIIAWLLEGMYALFGIHIYHLLLITLIPFYLGIWIIVCALYTKTKSYYSILAILPFCIANIFYQIVELGSSSFSMGWILLLYAVVFYRILNPIKNSNRKWNIVHTYIYTFITGIIFIIALLSRHNAILQIWPVTFVWITSYLNRIKMDSKTYLKKFVILAILSSLLCSALLIGCNKALTRNDSGDVHPATHIILHQIVGSCAPALDEKCFDEKWWQPNWASDPNKMIRLYKKYRHYKTKADSFYINIHHDIPFRYFVPLDNLYKKWIYAILHHPCNYIRHQVRYYKKLWFHDANPETKKQFSTSYSYEYLLIPCNMFAPVSNKEAHRLDEISKKIPENELRISWNSKKDKFDNYLRKFLPTFQIIWFIIANFVFFTIGLFMFIRNKYNICCMFLISSSFSGVLSSIVIPAFSPLAIVRYMNLVILCSVISFITICIINTSNKSKINEDDY